MTWHKGCLCGCLIPEECVNWKPREHVSHVIHHVVVHHRSSEVITATQVAERLECPGCGRSVSLQENGAPYRHKRPAGSPLWCTGVAPLELGS